MCMCNRQTDRHLSRGVTFDLQRALWVTDRKCVEVNTMEPVVESATNMQLPVLMSLKKTGRVA